MAVELGSEEPYRGREATERALAASGVEERDQEEVSGRARRRSEGARAATGRFGGKQTMDRE